MTASNRSWYFRQMAGCSFSSCSARPARKEKLKRSCFRADAISSFCSFSKRCCQARATGTAASSACRAPQAAALSFQSLMKGAMSLPTARRFRKGFTES